MFEPEDDGARLRPGLVLIHGGGWRIGGRNQQRWYSNHFAHEGYVVMAFEYREMPKHPFPDCLHDSKAAVRWLRANAAEYRVDPNHIVTFGASAGGHLAAFLATTTPEDGFEGTEHPGHSSAVKAAAILYGAVDLRKYDKPPKKHLLNKRERRYIARFVGADRSLEDDPAWAKASPITYIGPDTAPTILAHGTGDFIVHPEQSKDYHKKLEENGVPTKLLLYEGRNHGFDYIHRNIRRAMFDEMIAFLDEHAPYPGRKRSGE